MVWYVSVLVVATCGLVYELIAATLASYLLGDSVTHFSLIIGCYIFAMGLGAHVSKYIDKHLVRVFIDVQLCVALLGGLSAPILFVAFGRTHHFESVLFAVVIGVGALVGLELPLLLRILRDVVDFKELVSKVLTVDYIGGLLASLVFPLVCVPHLGLVRTSVVFGLLNMAVAWWGTVMVAQLTPAGKRLLQARAAFVGVLLVATFWQSERLTRFAEQASYVDRIVYTDQSPYQRVVVTRGRSGFALYLNGGLQFASGDERRYHEALVHVPMLTQAAPEHILVMGGGDGLALREVLRWPTVRDVTLVDLDPAMTKLSERFAPLAQLNEHAFEDKRVRVVNEDAMAWLKRTAHLPERYDIVLIDFPDPNNFSLGKLYTQYFYTLLRGRLAPEAAVAVQSTSPLFARESFWCVVNTMRAAGFYVQPYHLAVPSFGVWGFTLARLHEAPFPHSVGAVPPPLHYLNDAALVAMQSFSADTGPVQTDINRLDNQALVRAYEREWRRWD